MEVAQRTSLRRRKRPDAAGRLRQRAAALWCAATAMMLRQPGYVGEIVSILFSVCPRARAHTHTHTHTHALCVGTLFMLLHCLPH
ncbi:hypothetical protein ACU4GD_16870 [Cupriavidus basilensis]